MESQVSANVRDESDCFNFVKSSDGSRCSKFIIEPPVAQIADYKPTPSTKPSDNTVEQKTPVKRDRNGTEWGYIVAT